MKSLLIITFVTLFIASCQNNIIAPTVDCNQSSLDFTAIISNTDCGLSTGIIEIIETGGEPPYSYSIDGGATQETPKFVTLAAGEYKVKVTDNLGCTIEKTETVASVNGLTVSATTTASDCGSTNGVIRLTAINGTEPYQYKLDNGVPQASPDFLVGPGMYIILTTDNNGCEFSLSKIVKSNTSYNTEIQPIMANSCATTGCHNGSVSSLPNFNDLSEVQSNASMIKSRTQSGNMPKTGTLSQNQIDLIACWVDDGALDN